MTETTERNMEATFRFVVKYREHPMEPPASLDNCRKCGFHGRLCETLTEHDVCGNGMNGYFTTLKGMGHIRL
jgi:hypothetical protein